jgi:chromate transport protein ChrA
LAAYSFVLWSFPGLVFMTGVAIGVSSISELPSWAGSMQNGLTSSAIGIIALAALRLSEKLVTRKIERILALTAASLAISVSEFLVTLSSLTHGFIRSS